jgi:hypothetical protein
LRHQVGRSVDETLRLVQAFQYTDKHGEVCPAGWKPGADTIVPDPKEKLDYFTKHDEEGPDSPPSEELWSVSSDDLTDLKTGTGLTF